MKYRIKNMVCRHCVAAVSKILADCDIDARGVEIGSVTVAEKLDAPTLARFKSALAEEGFELISDYNMEVVEMVKHAVMHHVRDEQECKLKLSACVEEQIGLNYDTVSRIFSHLEGRTIEKYHIAQKVERVKELLKEGGRSLDEIADIVGYSSAAHLSRQFKSVTGLTPTMFAQNNMPRKPLDKV